MLTDQPQQPDTIEARTSDIEANASKYVDADPAAYEVLSKVVKDVSDHEFLIPFAIKLTFRKKDKFKGGRRVLGEVRVFKERDRHLHGFDAEVTVEWDFWRDNEAKREALIDHELCHLVQSGTQLMTLGHDFEDFYAVIRRRGYWSADLTQLQVTQLELQLESR